MNASVARKMHRTLEAYHAMVYFAPEAQLEYAALGVTDDEPFKGYFASRASAMGAVPGEVVVATFFNFHPALVLAAIPSAWTLASPPEWQAARLRGVDAALQRLLGDELDGPSVHESLALAREACTSLPVAGRPLFAAHASLPWPDHPHLALWHAVTLLREFRGDGHIACLVERDVSPCEALVLHELSGMIPPGFLQPTRQWSTDDWDAAKNSLVERGWVDGDALTAAGAGAREDIERRTDEVAMAPWLRLGEAESGRLRQLVRPLSKAIVAGGGFITRSNADGEGP